MLRRAAIVGLLLPLCGSAAGCLTGYVWSQPFDEFPIRAAGPCGPTPAHPIHIADGWVYLVYQGFAHPDGERPFARKHLTSGAYEHLPWPRGEFVWGDDTRVLMRPSLRPRIDLKKERPGWYSLPELAPKPRTVCEWDVYGGSWKLPKCRGEGKYRDSVAFIATADESATKPQAWIQAVFTEETPAAAPDAMGDPPVPRRMVSIWEGADASDGGVRRGSLPMTPVVWRHLQPSPDWSVWNLPVLLLTSSGSVTLAWPDYLLEIDRSSGATTERLTGLAAADGGFPRTWGRAGDRLWSRSDDDLFLVDARGGVQRYAGFFAGTGSRPRRDDRWTVIPANLLLRVILTPITLILEPIATPVILTGGMEGMMPGP